MTPGDRHRPARAGSRRCGSASCSRATGSIRRAGTSPARARPTSRSRRCSNPSRPWRDKVLILSNLAHREGGGSHHAAAVAFLSGARTPGSIDVAQPVTIDQLAAERLGGHTPLRSLELTADSLFLSQPRCSYISYGRDGRPVPREDDPQIVFDRLFRSVRPAERLPRTRSILDAVREDAAGFAAVGERRRSSDARRLFRGRPRRRTGDRGVLAGPRARAAGSPMSGRT